MPLLAPLASSGAVLLSFVVGTFAGAIVAEGSDPFIIGDGHELRLALVTVKPRHAICFFSFVALTIVLGVVGRGETVPVFGFHEIYCMVLVGSFGALYVTDVRTRLLPEFWTIPILICGLLEKVVYQPSMLADSVEAGLAIVVARYSAGFIWDLVIVLNRTPLPRLEAYFAYGDVVLIAACSVWIGFARMEYFLLILGLLCVLIALVHKFRPAFLWSRQVARLLPSTIHSDKFHVVDEAIDPTVFPFGGIVIGGFLLNLAFAPLLP
jgi:prepilin signal peptidase PulO-like enzyme (type II secretory pathway)